MKLYELRKNACFVLASNVLDETDPVKYINIGIDGAYGRAVPFGGSEEDLHYFSPLEEVLEITDGTVKQVTSKQVQGEFLREILNSVKCELSRKGGLQC